MVSRAERAFVIRRRVRLWRQGRYGAARALRLQPIRPSDQSLFALVVLEDYLQYKNSFAEKQESSTADVAKPVYQVQPVRRATPRQPWCFSKQISDKAARRAYTIAEALQWALALWMFYSMIFLV